MKKICLAFISFLLLVGCTSFIQKEDVLSDAKKVMQIQETWEYVESSTEDVIALLFYSQDLKEGKYAIYEKDEMDGFILKNSGELIADREMVTIGNCRIFISMNLEEACRYEIENLCKAQSTSIDNKKPFVLIILDEGEVFFYNLDGNKV